MENIVNLLKNKQIISIAPHYDGTHSSIVLTHQGSLYRREYVEDLMEQLCRYFGSTLEGRKNATRHKLNVRKNPPIIISEILQVGAFEIPNIDNEPMWIFDLQYKIKELKNGSQLLYDGQLPIYTSLSENVVNNRKRNVIHMLHEFIHVLVNYK